MITSDAITNVSFIVVFMEGLLSFFSPCVLPMLPIYIGYLSGTHEAEVRKNRRTKLLLFTICFIVGIFAGVLLMHATFSAFANFFIRQKDWMARIGGAIIILLGLQQLGILKIGKLNQTFQLKSPVAKQSMNIFIAFVMGFTFSFAWTPCIGPAMTSILVLSANASSMMQGILLACLYALGLSLPFLLVGLFTDVLLVKLQSYKKYMNVAVKIGAVLMIGMGVWLIGTTLKQPVSTPTENETIVDTEPNDEDNKDESNSDESETIMAPSIILKDLYDNEIALSDYKGKIVYLNFWGTWCPACRSELGSLQKLYTAYQESDEVAVLTIINGAYRESGSANAKEFMEINELTFPVLYDETGEWFYKYGVSSYPTTFMINQDGSVFGYLEGAINYDAMEAVIEMTRKGTLEVIEGGDKDQ